MDFKQLLLIPILLSAGLQCRADAIINITTLPTVQLNGEYEGYAGATINGNIPLALLCDDINHTTFVPSGNLPYHVSTISDLSAVRFGGPNALHDYREAALLILGDGTSSLAGIANVTDPNLIASYQYALWHVFAPQTGAFGTSAALGAQAYQDAFDNSPASLAKYNQLRIYTPTGSYTAEQETLSTVAAVPEPGALMLFGTALLGTVFVSRRKR